MSTYLESSIGFFSRCFFLGFKTVAIPRANQCPIVSYKRSYYVQSGVALLRATYHADYVRCLFPSFDANIYQGGHFFDVRDIERLTVLGSHALQSVHKQVQVSCVKPGSIDAICFEHLKPI